jgi:hypothetical protein
MTEQFSEATKMWLEKQGVLRTAEDRFFYEWVRILRSAERRLKRKGWGIRLFGDRSEFMQVYRPYWPSGLGGVHYQPGAWEWWRRQGIFFLGLAIEGETPKQQAVCARIRKLLRQYQEEIWSITGCSIRDEPGHEILFSSLPLADLTADNLCEGIENMAQTESFVDEALFLADRESVWRTGFLPGDPKPSINWPWEPKPGPEEGGWQFSADGGRFDSPCLKCYGGKSNYWEGKNILRLNVNGPLYQFVNGQPVYGSAVLHASEGGWLQFYAEGHHEGKYFCAFDGSRDLKAADRWQLVSWEGAVSNPENYDFAKQGLSAFVMVKAPDTGLKIDAIEIGLRWEAKP